MELQEQIKDWKEKYTFVYKINLIDKDFYFRTLTRDDYIQIMGAQAQASPIKPFDHDLEVIKHCLLSEYDEKELTSKAGIATVIAEKIMILSGFEQSDIEEV